MNNRISLQELIAYNNTPKAKALVMKYGYSPAKSYDDLIYKLQQICRDYRDEAFEDMAKLHPHRDLIMEFSTDKPEEKSNACGCSDCEGHDNKKLKKYSNFEYAEEYIDFIGKKNNQSDTMQKFNEYLPMIAVAGLFALAITAINKKA